jgi:hypothetical protein
VPFDRDLGPRGLYRRVGRILRTFFTDQRFKSVFLRVVHSNADRRRSPNMGPFEFGPLSRGHKHGSRALDCDRIFDGVITLFASERVHIEAPLAGFNTGKFHRLVALGTRENANVGDAE